MNSDAAKQLSDAIESALSIPIPEIDQLVQQYQLSEVLEIIIEPISRELRIKINRTPPVEEFCTYPGGIPKCSMMPEEPILGETLALDSEMVQEFCTNIASKVFPAMTFLSQSGQEVGETFKVLLILNPATANNRQAMFCKYVNDSTQDNIFHYSDL
jgi:hypothetical protein